MAKGKGAAVCHPGVEIIDVWATNLEAEIFMIRNLVDDFPFVAMDTEFPGVAITPLETFGDPADSIYESVRSNVGVLHLLQLGLAFFDASGNIPTSPVSGRPVVWQFNFREFDVDRDIHVPESIELLRKSGINFQENKERGVDAKLFSELLTTSGAVLNHTVHWVAFHGTYDFGYLIKILTCKPLPESREEFVKLLRLFFPILYDIKRVIRGNQYLFGSLNSIAGKLGVTRAGASHQAGSDALVTARIFIEMQRARYVVSIERYAGFLFGLDTESAQGALRKRKAKSLFR